MAADWKMLFGVVQPCIMEMVAMPSYRFAKSLDVAAHEMSHGVIQNTANLTYQGESGALNESFADIFGILVDRNDWQLGEEVVNPNIFRTGALRDMQNPNNGGSRLGDPGYQPAHVSEQYHGRRGQWWSTY